MKETKNFTFIFICVVAVLIVSFYGYRIFFLPSYNFPLNEHFIVKENESIKSISYRLQEDGYIYSALFFRTGVSFLGKDKNIQLGEYVFDKPVSLLSIIEIFVKGKPDLPLLSVTVPEGSTSFEIASIFSKVLPNVSTNIFTDTISKYDAHGKLFPSTYFLLPSYTEEDIVRLMISTFTKKTENMLVKENIPSPLSSREEVIVLASLLEGEAKTEVDMKLVSGILIRRLKIGMPLQVDAAKETYKKKGLPSEPINNPGIIAIRAVLHPTESKYLYYLTGNDGLMHYAETFEEHKRNVQRYLK